MAHITLAPRAIILSYTNLFPMFIPAHRLEFVLGPQSPILTLFEAKSNESVLDRRVLHWDIIITGDVQFEAESCTRCLAGF